MEKTTLYLPRDLQLSLRQASRRAGKPQAVLVREALEEYLSRQVPQTFQAMGIGEDRELAGRDAEAWLNAAWGRR